MRFADIPDRLSAFPHNVITFYDAAGNVVRKDYRSVLHDLRQTIARLEQWGVEPGMRVGILATNSYEWVLHDLALMHLQCTSVAFPDEFGVYSSGELIEKYRLALLLLSVRDNWATTAPGSATAFIDQENADVEIWRYIAATDAEPIFSLTFSSGTAGRIKCLITNERGAEETIASFYHLFDFRPTDSFLVFLPLSSFQQRLMIYAGFYYGFDLLLVSPQQALKAFKELKPTLVLAPPLLYESIHTQFKNAVRNLSPVQRAMLRGLRLGSSVPVGPVRKRLLKVCYGKIYESLGGRIRIMWTGMAPIKRATLDFFAELRLPLYEAYGLTECGAITTNTSSHNRRGSVGRPVIEGSVFLANDGEIMVRQQHLQTSGYLEGDANEQALTYVEPNVVATGDIGRFDDDGYLFLIGRKKEIIITTQGFKTHPETLEALIDRCPEIERSVVFGNGMPYLVALISIQEPRTERVEEIIKKSIGQLNAELTPAGRIAKFVITTEQFTRDNGFLTRNLKLDRRAIFKHFEQRLTETSDQPEPAREPAAQPTAPATASVPEYARIIAGVWREVLAVKEVRRDDNFFDLGGNSLLLSEMQTKLSQTLKRELPIVELFNHPTVESLAKYLSTDGVVQEEVAPAKPQRRQEEPIAIIGMAGRFPGAKSTDELWQNVCAGVESISFFSEAELKAAGVSPGVFNRPNYIRAKPVLADMDLFDAAFFGFNPREAEIMDPQHRVFLECAWGTLENAGYDADRYRGKIGVYAGASLSTYVFSALMSLNGLESMGALQQVGIGNGLGSLATRVSYKLNLKGPSVSVQTACSTSLSAVHLACQSLLDRECDIALAGGVSIIVPNNEGYEHLEGGIFSPDGHCRAFDAKAQGTIVGDGVALVALKRLSEAVADGDSIHAVLLGSAMNNDGSAKVGFTAPSVEGQTEVIRAAHANAGISADSIGYIEAHGTGTQLGDPIEVQALTKAFRATTEKKGFCGLGSLKTNIGHLDTAAGIAGLIKTALALKHKQLPPSLHFEEPNPQIDFANSPFYVNTTLTEWKTDGLPRRAGVSSFGFGGTNIHVVMEEPPEIVADAGPGRDWNLVVLSARSERALQATSANLKDHLERHSDLNMNDVAYTCQVGRKAFRERQAIVCHSLQDCLEVLESNDQRRILSGTTSDDPFVVFMFPGQGAQHVNMAVELYRTEQTFKEIVDQCCEFLQPMLGFDLRQLLFSDAADVAELNTKLDQTSATQPALFVIEYALARLWMEWGIHPQAMIGHSIGEYVAACLANVFTLEDALTLVAARGKLIGDLPGGAMLAIPFSEAEVKLHLNGELSLAALNSPSLSVVSGPVEAIDRLQKQLTEQELICHRLHTSHAFHSVMVDPILESFTALVAKANPQPPQAFLISNLTGTWMQSEEAIDPTYWSRHLRHTVRFARGLETLSSEHPRLVLLEVGPGQNLSGLAAAQLDRHRCSVIPSLPHPRKPRSEVASMLEALGKLWVSGVTVDWDGFNAKQRRRRFPLPTYPFERQRYWVEAKPVAQTQQQIAKRFEVSEWFYLPSWKQSPSPRFFGQALNGDSPNNCWLLFTGNSGLGDELARALRASGQTVVTVGTGEQFSASGENSYTISPRSAADYSALLDVLVAEGKTPRKIIHLWNVDANDEIRSFDETQYAGLHSLVFLARGIGEQRINTPLELFVVSDNLHAVVGNEQLNPAKATLLSPCKVIPQEYPQIRCRSIDISGSFSGELIDSLLAECNANSQDSVVAYRNGNRWVQTYEPLSLNVDEPGQSLLRDGGVYLILGALGRIGSIMSEYLAEKFKARLVWTTRTTVPDRAEWSNWLKNHGDDDPASVAIRKALHIEGLGGSVTIVTADLGNRDQMLRTSREILERYGEINGIFHAAGQVVMGEETAQTIQDVQEVDYEVHFQTKVKGLMILEEILGEVKPNFCLLISSISSVLGGLGLTAYTAANIFMDAFARAATQRTSVPWTTINLDTWQVETELQPSSSLGASITELAISPSEGKEIFSRLLPRIGFQQLVVSTAPLQARIDQWLKLVSLREAEQARPPGTLYPRPALREPYVAPASEVQLKMAEVWQRVLAIEGIGINDDFFELGGNSLLATQLVMETREAFRMSVPLRDFFEKPTVAALAAVIETNPVVKEVPRIKRISRESLRVDRQTLTGLT
jgi:acyl transferase domain-containing protein/long-subunit acyl-CoA synthetase (AMP-forming)/acyl carrier protein